MGPASECNGLRRIHVAAATVLLLGAAGCPAVEDPTGPIALPERLGTTEAQLRAEFGEALRPAEIERPRGVTEQIMEARRRAEEAEAPASPAEAPDPFAEQLRLARDLRGGDVRRVEYELFRGSVYRIRWRLSERFERPLMDPLVAHLRQRFGKPAYDQLIEGKLGSGRATLRRTAWQHRDRTLELRQLHPRNGGPLYLTLSDQTAIRSIVGSRGSVLPEPESSGPWWQEAQRPPVVLTPEETESLIQLVDAQLSRIDF